MIDYAITPNDHIDAVVVKLRYQKVPCGKQYPLINFRYTVEFNLGDMEEAVLSWIEDKEPLEMFKPDEEKYFLPFLFCYLLDIPFL